MQQAVAGLVLGEDGVEAQQEWVAVAITADVATEENSSVISLIQMRWLPSSSSSFYLPNNTWQLLVLLYFLLLVMLRRCQ